VKVGQRVAVGCFVNSCGTCASCKEGHENYCETGFTMTYGSPSPDGKTQTFGGYSNQIVVDEHFVLNLPANLDPAGAAPLLCAGITTYSPLRHVGVTKGSRVAVMGLGGLGHMAVKLAASFGAEVTMLSRSPGKKADAHKLGAHDFVLTKDNNALGAAGQPLRRHRRHHLGEARYQRAARLPEARRNAHSRRCISANLGSEPILR